VTHVAYRAGARAELATIVSFKLRMYREHGVRDQDLVADVEAVIQREYERLWDGGDLQPFLALEDGEIVACAVALIKRDPPFCFFVPPCYGFVADVYTRPESRRRGHARRLTREVLVWLREKGVKRVALLPSSTGRPLYESLGFRACPEMVLYLE
jgi:GNAT superfamily N-acetyltransferase